MKKFFSILGGITLVALSVVSISLAFTQEQQEAYQWAYKYGLTTQPTIEKARMNSPLTRQAFAKMVVNYLENVVGVKQYTTNSCYFPDESKITDDLVPYTKKTCAYQIMGSDGKKFSPTQPIDRAQLGTVFSRILWGDKHNANGKGYYIYHVNALEDVGIMNNIKNVLGTTAKRGDVMIMFKRMYEKFGTNVYLNSGKDSNYIVPQQAPIIEYEDSDNEYVSSAYSDSNVIYTGKDGTKYYYDDKFLSLLKNTAEKEGETDLADYLEIEAAYFKNGLDQLDDLDDERLHKIMGIDTDSIDPDNMTKEEKQELIKKFKSAFDVIIGENKDRNDKLIKDLEKVTKNIGKDKFGLKAKYKKTKTFMEASNEFLDVYSKTMLDLMEIALMKEDNDENSEAGLAQAFGLIGIALAYQGTAQEYQTYVEEWAVDTVNLLGGELDTSSVNYVSGEYDNQNSNQRLSVAETRARDVERKASLSQVQSAIVVSQGDKGKWPGMDKGASQGISIFDIEDELKYAGMSRIPSDPIGNNEVIGLGSANIVKGGYAYLVTKRNGVSNGGFVLMTKMELAGQSNRVVCENKSGLDNGYITNDTDLTDIQLCSKIKEGNSCSASKCTYTNDDELRYIVIY